MPRQMKKITSVVFIVAAACFLAEKGCLLSPKTTTPPRTSGALESPPYLAIANQSSGAQVEGSGTVTKILADDNFGSRHQRFILRLSSGQTVLIAHNIDIAPRIATLALGQRVEFSGQFEWNSQGGVIHWTHHDPAGRHPAGWLRCAGQTYR